MYFITFILVLSTHTSYKTKKKQTCADPKTATRFFRKNKLQIIYKDMFTDISDGINPVKYYINENL